MEPYNTIKDYLDNTPQDDHIGLIEYLLIGPPTWEEYVNNFQDLIDAKIENGCRHFLYNGWKEKRMASKGYQLAPSTVVGWNPPTTPGLHTIFTKAGGFGMSVARTATGLLAGTYRKDGLAKLYSFDGTLHEELSLAIESFYMIVIPPDGLPVISTEVPAQILKKQSDGTYSIKRLRSEDVSCAFEVIPHGDGLMVQTVDRAAGLHTQMFKGDANGNNFTLWQDIPNKYLLNYGTDGSQVKMVGATEATANGFPMIVNPDGSDLHQRGADSGYQDIQYSYAVGKGGRWSLGAQTITASREHRKAFVDIWDGSNLRSIQDFGPPWTMDAQIDSNGTRWIIASSWDETDHDTSELWKSTDNGEHFVKALDIPMRSVIAMYFADGGIYLIGGQYGIEMKCLFYKF